MSDPKLPPVTMSVDQKAEESALELLALLKEARHYVALGVANVVRTSKDGRKAAGKLLTRVCELVDKIEGK